tara:strand:+ start:492 stop:902 length:411 start_codon:yes stop_codon:yes gene_type:complete
MEYLTNSLSNSNVSNSHSPTEVKSEVNKALLSHDNENKCIPSWDDLSSMYESRWHKEKEKFQNDLKKNFFALVERYASGKQELFMLSAPDRREKLYIRAFLEIFESGYAPHVGDAERLAGKKIRRLYITLPHNYHD